MTVEVQVLGRFAVRRDGAVLPPFPRRDAAALVKLLALTPGHTLRTERAIDLLWPDQPLAETRPRLHKAAHYARRALGRPDAVVLRGEQVALCAGEDVVVDAESFETAAGAALAGDPAARADACAQVAGRFRGDLLPEDTAEPWTEDHRARLKRRRAELLRAAGRWEELLELDPADELAHLALLRRALDAGDRSAALRRYEQLERALRDELDVAPGAEARALRARALELPQKAAAASARSGLVERDGELARLEALLTSAASGRGAVVVLTGEAGSGKTALLQAFLDRARDRVEVRCGGCDDLLAPRSLGPFRDIAETAPGELAGALARGDPETVLPALLRMLARAPGVVAIEDLHWADDATIDALRYLTRRIRETPTLLVLTCREGELDRSHPMRKLLGTFAGPSLHRLPLRPLSLPAVATLAGPGVDAVHLHRITRGNAFYVSEVIAAGGDGVPTTVRDAVLARLAALSPEARDAVARLAVLPTRADRRLAEQLSDERPAALVEAERAGVLAGDAAHVWFRHEIARAAVLSTLTPGERVEAHRRALDALLLDPAADRALVVHHARAAHRTDVLLEVGPAAAADAVRSGAQRSAAEIVRAVLETGAVRDPATMASLLAQRAYALYYLNRFEEAFDNASRAVAHAEPTGDCRLHAETLSVLTKAAFWARGPLAARRAAERAVGLLEQSGEPGRLSAALADLARAHSNLATLGIVAEPAHAAVPFGTRALALADELDRDDLRCQALMYLGSSRLAGGDEQGAADLARAIALGSTDPRLELHVRAHVNAAGGAYRRGRFDDALEYVERGLRLARHGEFFGGDYRLRLTRSAVLASSGRWDDAVAELRVLLAVDSDPAAMGSLARALLARLLARRGDAAGAVAALDASSARHHAAEDPYVGGPLATAAVELAWLGGDVAAMPGLAAPALRVAAETGHRGSRSELCRYLQRAGHAVEAAPPDPLGPWAPALAGRPVEAAAAWHALGERYEEAVELALAAEPHRSRGLRELERLGAVAAVAVLRG